MKKLIILLFVFAPFVSLAQKVENKSTREVKDLKECVENYCMLILDSSLGLNSETINADVETDGQNILRFVGENGEKKKFKTITEVFNYMYSNGWEFKESIGRAVVGVESRYLFAKIKH